MVKWLKRIVHKFQRPKIEVGLAQNPYFPSIPDAHIREAPEPEPALGEFWPPRIGRDWSGITTLPCQIHVVAEGETLAQIAYDYGIPARILMKANGIRQQWCIVRGQRLIIPGHPVEINDT